MKAGDLSCWKCGVSLEGVPMPISRLSECLSCRCSLHVCRMCEFYDVAVAQDCREPLADEVKDKTWANFCEHFFPRAGAFEPTARTDGAPSAELDALFGGGPATPAADAAARGADSEGPEDRARRELEALFGKKEPD